MPAAAPAAEKPAPSERPAFDPFGLSLDGDATADVEVDISIDDGDDFVVGDLTLEPPPAPAKELATPLDDLAPAAPTSLEAKLPTADADLEMLSTDAIEVVEVEEELPSLEPMEPLAPVELTTPKAAEPGPKVEAPAPPKAAEPKAEAEAAPAAGESRAQITAATREIIEQVVWEVVPELAETIIREEIDRLLRARGAK